jgi:hypothetical protein
VVGLEGRGVDHLERGLLGRDVRPALLDDGGEVDRNRPFTIAPDGTDTRNASCMSAESAMQTYLTYRIQYCNSDDEEDASLYVIPDEAELAPNEVYEIRSVTPCRANDLQKVAFGPSNESCN